MDFFIKLLAWVGVLGSGIGCFLLWPDRYSYGDSHLPALMYLFGGLVSSFLLYAFGHLVERVDALHLMLSQERTAAVNSTPTPTAEHEVVE